jgi:hypothetical protein
MEYDLTNPAQAAQSVKPEANTLTKEFIPSLKITEIPDFETFALDPDKYLSQVADAGGTQVGSQESTGIQADTQEQPLPPTQSAQEKPAQPAQPPAQPAAQANNDMPKVQVTQSQPAGEGAQEQPEKESLA